MCFSTKSQIKCIILSQRIAVSGNESLIMTLTMIRCYLYITLQLNPRLLHTDVNSNNNTHV